MSTPSPPSAGGEPAKKVAACAKSRGAVLYGAHWCGYTRRQLELFGESRGEINYVECSDKNPTEHAACVERGISAYPTWLIDEKQVRGYRDLEALGRALRCPQ